MIRPTIGGNFEDYFKNKFNFEQLKQNLAVAVARQSDDFIGQTVANQMTGRHGDRYLNVKTGHLRQGWFSATVINGEAIRTEVFTDVPYARIHQYGGVIHQMARSGLHGQATRTGGRFVKHANFQGKRVLTQHQKMNLKGSTFGERTIKIPKRLYVVEDFTEQFAGRMKNAMVEVLKEAGF